MPLLVGVAHGEEHANPDAVWTGGSGGVAKHSADDADRLNTIDRLDDARALAVDPRRGDAWVASGGQLHRLNPDASVQWSTELDGASEGESRLRLLAGPSDGSVWLIETAGAQRQGGGLVFARGSQRQLAQLTRDGEDWQRADLNDAGPGDTQSIRALGPATADFDGNGSADVAYLQSADTLRVLDGGAETAARRIDISSAPAVTGKTRLAVGAFADAAAKIFYVGANQERLYFVERADGAWQGPELAADV
ncbi:MAG: hypothetical protein BRD57_02055, partial [Proteobacteria bacterium SW_6_67_9]